MSAKPKPFSCGGCKQRWSGENTSHCAKCHETFSSVKTFDKHQRIGKYGTDCLNPVGLRLSMGKRGYWSNFSTCEAARGTEGESNG